MRSTWQSLSLIRLRSFQRKYCGSLYVNWLQSYNLSKLEVWQKICPRPISNHMSVAWVRFSDDRIIVQLWQLVASWPKEATKKVFLAWNLMMSATYTWQPLLARVRYELTMHTMRSIHELVWLTDLWQTQHSLEVKHWSLCFNPFVFIWYEWKSPNPNNLALKHLWQSYVAHFPSGS